MQNKNNRTTASKMLDVKKVFGGVTERDFIVDSVANHFSDRPLSWLDVGIGDGRSTRLMETELAEHNITIKITGIDPELDYTESVYTQNADVILTSLGVENFESKTQYDVINVRQSAYYFDDIKKRLFSLLHILVPKGQLFLTHWSKDCLLYDMHTTFRKHFSLTPLVSIEDVAGWFKDESNYLATFKLFTDEVNVNGLRNDEDIAAAFFDVTLRRCVDLTEREKCVLIEQYFNSQNKAPTCRCNGVLILERK